MGLFVVQRYIVLVFDETIEKRQRIKMEWRGNKDNRIFFMYFSLVYNSKHDHTPIQWVVIRIHETGRVESICSTATL